jgi:hypothetical protein
MKLFLIWLIAAAAIGLGALSVEAATDSQTMAKNCWVDVFDDTKYDADDPHVRVQGPIELSSLKDLQGRNWSNEIQSVIVGPDASVRAYKDKEFKGRRSHLRQASGCPIYLSWTCPTTSNR